MAELVTGCEVVRAVTVFHVSLGFAFGVLALAAVLAVANFRAGARDGGEGGRD